MHADLKDIWNWIEKTRLKKNKNREIQSMAGIKKPENMNSMWKLI